MLAAEVVRRLEPLSAASGMVAMGSRLIVVADDRDELASFPRTGDGPGVLIAGVDRPPGPTDRAARKAWKADLEALAALPDGGLLALGSGSRPARRAGVHWSAPVGGTAGRPVDLRLLHAALDAELHDLNLEGACVLGDRLVLAQRGNGQAGVNALAVLALGLVQPALRDGAPIPATALLAVHVVEGLGRADDGTPLTLTDLAALPDGRLLASAVAERGESTYDDGPCTAAAMAVLRPDGRVDAVHRLDRPWKVEGVVVDGVEVLLCVDPDDPSTPATLLRAQLPADV